MKIGVVLGVVVIAYAGARVTRELAVEQRAVETVQEPYAPSAGAAPIVALGYREVAADLFYARLAPYFGGASMERTPEGVARLIEAIAALDPAFRRVYQWAANAMTFTLDDNPDQRIVERAIAILGRGATVFPNDWRIPSATGQMYLFDLKTNDPALRRKWDEAGARLLEAAARKPDAPANAGVAAAALQSGLGQRQRAIDGLRELLLVTSDTGAQRRILDKLAELEHDDADAIAAELLDAKQQFDKVWQRERPAVSEHLYILLGPRLPRSFDPRDLATGGRDLVGPPTNP